MRSSLNMAKASFLRSEIILAFQFIERDMRPFLLRFSKGKHKIVPSKAKLEQSSDAKLKGLNRDSQLPECIR